MNRLLGLIAGAVGAVVAALVITEVVMQPASSDRWALAAIFGATAALAVVLAAVVPRLLMARPSLSATFWAAPLVALGIAAFAVSSAAVPMFLSGHDLRLVLIALGLGLGLGIGVSTTLWRSMRADLDRIAATARAVGEGRRDVSTGVGRRDELGSLAATLDSSIRRLAEAEAAAADADGARRQFVASVSHDLRTPLTSMQAALEALVDGVADDPDRYLAAMKTDLTLLRGLVDDLLTLARIDMAALDLHPTWIDAGELADGVLDSARLEARRHGVEVRLEVAPGLGPVWADPHALARVLRNLVDNAVRHAPVASTVTLSVGAAGGAGGLAVSVRDEGPGFPAEFAPRAFDLFARADDSRGRTSGGAGLGLTIARGLVEAHGGTIRVVEHDEGSEGGGHVAFELPPATVGADSVQILR